MNKLFQWKFSRNSGWCILFFLLWMSINHIYWDLLSSGELSSKCCKKHSFGIIFQPFTFIGTYLPKEYKYTLGLLCLIPNLFFQNDRFHLIDNFSFAYLFSVRASMLVALQKKIYLDVWETSLENILLSIWWI